MPVEEKTDQREADEKVVEIELERLRSFANHPFKVQADSQMIELQDSIRKYGILNPLIVRPRPEGVYEIISGHRRKFAAEKLGYRKVPVIIRAMKDDEAVVSMVDSNLQRERISPSEKAFAYTEKRIAELSAIFKRLYEDSVTGRISDERFTELSADYEAEQRELKERAAAIQAELSKAQEATVNAEKFMNVVRRHTSFEELTPTLLREFVEKIVVHECSYDENKTRRQDIEIYYSFVGKVDLPE